MAYNILGIHPGHNSSVALVSDGKLVYYLEEERLSRFKRDYDPFKVIIDICFRYKINELIIGGTNDPKENYKLPISNENIFSAFIKKYYPNIKTTIINSEHHLTHALCAFYNSGFNEAAILVIDGAGSLKHNGYECESIFTANLNKVSLLYSSTYLNPNDGITITKYYEAVTKYLGWDYLEGGKTMGLAPYGKQNHKIPQLFKNGRGNKNLFLPQYPSSAEIKIDKNSIFYRKHNPKEWHKDPTKISKIETDLAWQVQNDTQKEVIKLIKKLLKLTNKKQICIVGGYGLNCVANYFLKKSFPNLEIYHEPISHDGGTAIGAAYFGWKKYQPNIRFPKQTSVYYGPRYDPTQYLTIIKNYLKMFNKQKANYKDIAKLISERNIVCIFQGRSEAGPRALGNRSILYDPTDPNGKDFVNKVKKREWFRPFAGTVLLEKANEWFDMAGLEESPFMMYAMDVWPDKQEKIKAITHVDGTCRIQTVTKEQNFHYYNLIQEFEKITGVPILFNTSFNLAGDPLVETIDHAVDTLLRSELKYLYLPELEMLLEKK